MPKKYKYEGKLKLSTKDRLCTAKICNCTNLGLKYASGKPKLIRNYPFLERYVYPCITPVLKPIREIIKNSYNTIIANEKS
jgi:hypothetical protein